MIFPFLFFGHNILSHIVYREIQYILQCLYWPPHILINCFPREKYPKYFMVQWIKQIKKDSLKNRYKKDSLKTDKKEFISSTQDKTISCRSIYNVKRICYQSIPMYLTNDGIIVSYTPTSLVSETCKMFPQYLTLTKR